ncbi:hypothetical protein BRADI_1g30845v3 [Brachypodium distachyon]|uniref:Uncharacterized protein n=1 Tax=Brachypodium distachyon TaxID=15368 RepID=A0A0Q3H1K3_BRADI|nr:hypothetical protein BRADI_1g30845v3 [Brachypodium distachyon]
MGGTVAVGLTQPMVRLIHQWRLRFRGGRPNPRPESATDPRRSVSNPHRRRLHRHRRQPRGASQPMRGRSGGRTGSEKRRSGASGAIGEEDAIFAIIGHRRVKTNGVADRALASHAPRSQRTPFAVASQSK